MPPAYKPYLFAILLGDVAAVVALALGHSALGFFLLASTSVAVVLLVMRFKAAKEQQEKDQVPTAIDEGK